SSQPHYKSGYTKIEDNNVLLIDMGIKYKGYSGDLTRTFWIGDSVNKEFNRIYQIVIECNNECISEVKEEVDFFKIHRKAVEIFKKYNLEDKFIHSIEHSIGLDIHEKLFRNKKGEGTLKENMIVTIEPGLYFPDKFGIRIEDYILVQKDSSLILNSANYK